MQEEEGQCHNVGILPAAAAVTIQRMMTMNLSHGYKWTGVVVVMAMNLPIPFLLVQRELVVQMLIQHCGVG